MGRLFDLVVVSTAWLLFLPIILIVAVLVKLTSSGKVIYWSDRVGRANIVFKMPKFRTMRSNTPVVATHLLQTPELYFTPIGAFLRRTSLDELPQLWSVLIGHISIVGPRPALFNQHDLIAMRKDNGIDQLRPGVTGWAQINGRDEISIKDKVKLEVEYLSRKNIFLDILIIFKTIIKVIGKDSISH